jgi:hypothetical protein
VNKHHAMAARRRLSCNSPCGAPDLAAQLCGIRGPAAVRITEERDPARRFPWRKHDLQHSDPEHCAEQRRAHG